MKRGYCTRAISLTLVLSIVLFGLTQLSTRAWTNNSSTALALSVSKWTPLFPSARRKASLGFDRIVVIHLATRRDRLERLQSLERALGLSFQIATAITPASPEIASIMERVRRERQVEGWCFEEPCPEYDPHLQLPLQTISDDVSIEQRFQVLNSSWSQRSMFLSDAYVEPPTLLLMTPRGADLWQTDILPRQEIRFNVAVPVMKETSMSEVLRDLKRHVFVSFEAYNARKPFDPNLEVRATPLSEGEVSCWRSHVGALQAFVKSGHDTVLIFEDDVDMEFDIARRLEPIQNALPPNWDSLFLGHCWSHESVFPPIDPSVPSLRPSHTPKCTHAYAVSRAGALKILRHLRSPAFAYSMPLDRALTHLIATERIRSYSVYPPLVIQTIEYDAQSDIQSDARKVWEDKLEDSALHRVLDNLWEPVDDPLLADDDEA